MSEEPIAISNLNDFIFCPVSIYFHSLEDGDDILTKDSYQLNGSNAHRKWNRFWSIKRTYLLMFRHITVHL